MVILLARTEDGQQYYLEVKIRSFSSASNPLEVLSIKSYQLIHVKNELFLFFTPFFESFQLKYVTFLWIKQLFFFRKNNHQNMYSAREKYFQKNVKRILR